MASKHFLASLEKNRKGIGLMAVSSLFVATGQLFWKLSSDRGLGSLIIGFALYAVGALLMILAYRHGSLSVLQPMISLNYIFAIMFAWLILDESLSAQKFIGIGVVIIGVVLIGGGDE